MQRLSKEKKERDEKASSQWAGRRGATRNAARKGKKIGEVLMLMLMLMMIDTGPFFLDGR